MTIRLLFYTIEIWGEALKNTESKSLKRKFFKLSPRISIVLYNGFNKLTAKEKDMLKHWLLNVATEEDNLKDNVEKIFKLNLYQRIDVF